MQEGHYSNADLRFFLEHQGAVLAELDSFTWSINAGLEAGGKGLGDMKNRYYKQTDAAKGTWGLTRKAFDRLQNGALFADLLSGSALLLVEPVAAAATTYAVTRGAGMISIVEVRGGVSNVVYREGVDYTVAYTTGTLTFPIATPEALVIRYLAKDRFNQNLLQNGGFEDNLTSIWTPVATATIARNTANAYVEGNALAVTPAAVSDGVQYSLPINVLPGRPYRLMFKAKAAAAETLIAKWNDGTSDISMTPTNVTLAATYAAYEFTFTVTKAQIANIKIIDSKTGPALFYLDEIKLIDDLTGNYPSPTYNPMDAGRRQTFTFNVIAQRTVDNTNAFKLMQCAIDTLTGKSANAYTEEIKGSFLEMIPE